MNRMIHKLSLIKSVSITTKKEISFYDSKASSRMTYKLDCQEELFLGCHFQSFQERIFAWNLSLNALKWFVVMPGLLTNLEGCMHEAVESLLMVI